MVRVLPVRSVAGALTLAPGVAVVDANSLGGNPRVIARGFYGGGETDYLATLIDGVPIAALGSGAVNWDMLSRGGISRLELVRGASSYIHGDAAVAGALNLVTEQMPMWSWRVAGGSHAIRDATVSGGFGTYDQRFDVSLDHDGSDGYRLHENRDASTLNARFSRYGDAGSVTVFASSHDRHFYDPGPLPSTTADRRAANQFFLFDHAKEKVQRAGVTAGWLFQPAEVTGYLTVENATGDAVKTLPLSPDFADTKRRVSRAPRVLGSAQVTLGDDSPGWLGRMVAGIDASAGRLKSRYADVASGSATDYSSATGTSGPSGPWSEAKREAAAGFVSWQVHPAGPVRLVASARFDQLHDTFNPGSEDGPRTTASHKATTPRVGANVALPAMPGIATNLYFSVGRVFKAPTLDQLFDERAIPIPVPPFSTTISNPLLEPQRGTAIEGGFYQTWSRADLIRLDLSASAYRERMRDELDFDVSTFRYVNIGRSLHRGLELGATLTGKGSWNLIGSIARQRVVAEAGQFDGRQLKAIPRRTASAAANFPLGLGLTAGVLASSVGGAFIDDQNTRPLPGYTRIDLRVGVPIGHARATIDLINAFNRRYDATAFPDPAGSAVNYRHPAAGRVFVLGIESR